MCASVPCSLTQRSPLANPRTSDAQARSGPGRKTGDTSCWSAISCHNPTKPAATAKPAVRADAQDDLAEIKILAAEDNPTNQLVLRSLLQPLGVHLTLAANGRLAGTFPTILRMS